MRDYGTGTWDGGDPDCDHKQRANHDHVGNIGERDAAGNAFRNSSRYVNQGDMAKTTCRCGATRVDQQLGLEPTPDQYVQTMVDVFREVRRVMRDDGSLWLNIGDSFDDKQLVGVPWRLAFALQADGWWLRSDIIWSKPNPMPESVTDRPTKAHEYVFLLTKSARYYFDADAVREPHTSTRWGGRYHDGSKNEKYIGMDPRMAATAKVRQDREQFDHYPEGGRNVRSVWEIATQPYAEAHFATFPQELARRCIAAGTSEHGCCPECGVPWERQGDKELVDVWHRNKRPTKAALDTAAQEGGDQASRRARDGHVSGHAVRFTTTGWAPSCTHDHEPVPCTVLDPFLGSGTTALVARNQHRRSIGIELNPGYCQLAARRLQQQTLFA